MADSKFIQVNQAVVHVDVQSNFDRMAAALKSDKGIVIGIAQSYLSEYDLVDELRRLVKDKTILPPLEVKPLLDPAKKIADIVNENKYPILKKYIATLDQTGYEPALANSFTSVSNLRVYPIPNKLELDPRRTGRLLLVTPSDSLKGITLQRWLLNNGPLYGFVLYGDFALYYLGLDKISNKLVQSGNPDDEFVKITTQFLKPSSMLLQLANTSKKILEGIPPS